MTTPDAASDIPDIEDALRAAEGPKPSEGRMVLVRVGPSAGPLRPGLGGMLVVVALVLAGLAWSVRAYGIGKSGSSWVALLTWQEGVVLGTVNVVRNWGHPGEPGTLPAAGGLEITPLSWLNFPTIRELGSVRVTAEIEWTAQIDAFEIAVHCTPSPTPVWWMVPQGISCQFGGYQGAETTISLNQQADRPARQSLTKFDFVPGRHYRLTLESVDGVARLLVDGEVILEFPKLLPLAGTASDRIGLRCWAPVRLHSLAVERLRIPAAESPIAIGDALAAVGKIREAMHWYVRIADDHGDSGLAALALAKAAACAGALPDESATLASIRMRMATEHPDHALRDQVESVVCLLQWRSGNHASALDIAASLQERRPDSRIAMHLLSQRRGVIPAPYGRGLAILATRTPGLRQFDFSGLELVDLDFIAGIPVTNLDISSNPIQDLAVLRGMPLERLLLGNTGVQQLDALRGLPLRTLDLQHCPITDLAPLQGGSLEHLNLSTTGVVDLSPLRGQPLHRINLDSTKVVEVSPLAGAPLEAISLSHSPVTDLSALAGCPIRSAMLAGSAVADPSPVISPHLRDLNLASCPVENLEALAAATNLASLDVSGTKVRDLGPLRGLTMVELNIARTEVTDLSSLTCDALVVLNIEGTSVVDLSPMRAAPLQRLSARGARLASIRPLLGCPLEHVDVVDSAAVDFPLLSEIGTLRVASFTGVYTATSEWEDAVQLFLNADRRDLALACRIAAVEDTNPEALQPLAVDIGGIRRLVLGRQRDHDSALKLAEASGARLCWPRNAEDFRLLMQAVNMQGEVWTSARLRNGVPIGPAGEALDDLPSVRAVSDETLPVHLFWSGGDRGFSQSDPASSRREKTVILEW